MNSGDKNAHKIVVNDLLSFVWCKLKLFKKGVILNCLQKFYSKEEASESLKELLTVLPDEQRSVKNYQNPFVSILHILKKAPPDALPVFVCKDLNNIPKIESFIANDYNSYSLQSKKEFYKEHQRIKRQLNEVFSALNDLRSQFQLLTDDGNLSTDDKFKDDSDSDIISTRDFTHFHGIANNEEEIVEFPIKEEIDIGDIIEQRLNLLANRHQRASLKISSKDLGTFDNRDEFMEQRINLLANRRQRASLKLGSKDERNRLKQSEDSLSPKQKIIHIGKDERVSILDSSDHWNDSWDEEEISNEAEIEISSSSPHKSTKLENTRYLICEHKFDECIGGLLVYKCSLCGFASNDEITSMEHTCAKPAYNSKTNGKWNSNSKNAYKHREKNTYDCHSCGSSFKARKELQKHVETHLEDGHRCPLCSKRFSIEEWLFHVRTCSGDGSTLKEDHYCELCDVFYADKRTLSFHKAHHDQSRPFECLECKFRFYTQKAVEDHFRTHKLLTNAKKCPFCDFRTAKPAKIGDHIRCHTGDRPYKCLHCDRGCPTFTALKVHLTSHLPTRDFPCNICGKKFKSQSKVAVHRKIHTVERPHKCPKCGKGFKFGLQMAMHHRMHLNIRKHACTKCPYKARTAAILRGHMNTHTQSKPFKCTICDFSANHKSYLNWHLKCYHPSSDHLRGKIS